MNKVKSWTSSSVEESQIIAEELSTIFRDRDIIFLQGTLGSGKTFLVQNICANW